ACQVIVGADIAEPFRVWGIVVLGDQRNPARDLVEVVALSLGIDDADCNRLDVLYEQAVDDLFLLRWIALGRLPHLDLNAQFLLRLLATGLRDGPERPGIVANEGDLDLVWLAAVAAAIAAREKANRHS